MATSNNNLRKSHHTISLDMLDWDLKAQHGNQLIRVTCLERCDWYSSACLLVCVGPRHALFS